MERNLTQIYHDIHEQLLKSGTVWGRFGKKPQPPSLEDVKSLVDGMIDGVRESKESISIESGGVLVKRTDDYIDIYLHVGAVDGIAGVYTGVTK